MVFDKRSPLLYPHYEANIIKLPYKAAVRITKSIEIFIINATVGWAKKSLSPGLLDKWLLSLQNQDIGKPT